MLSDICQLYRRLSRERLVEIIMITFRKITIKRLLATALAAVIAVGSAAMAMNDSPAVITSMATPTLAEYQQKLNELQQQQDSLSNKIENASSELSGLQEKRDAINEQIALLEDKIKLVDEYTVQLEKAMADLDMDIRGNQSSLEDTENQINEGIADYKQRLRAIYIAGNSSYASILLESESFYDMLMRAELIKRVSEHDDQMIDHLVSLKTSYEEIQTVLSGEKDDLAATMATYTQTLGKLQEDKASLEMLKEQNEAAAAELDKLINDLSAEQSDVSKLQSQISKEAATATTTTTTTTTTTKKPEPLPPSQDSDGENGGDGGDEPDDPAPVPVETPAQSGDIATVLAYAKGMVGGRYVFAGSAYGATDCSGLTMQSYAQIGIKLPHKASLQASYGKAVSYDEMQPGDLIFFGYGSYSSIYHVAMYIGNGMMVHAESTATGIVISYIYQKDRIVTIKRLVD